jgi:hypothetical protein
VRSYRRLKNCFLQAKNNEFRSFPEIPWEKFALSARAASGEDGLGKVEAPRPKPQRTQGVQVDGP